MSSNSAVSLNLFSLDFDTIANNISTYASTLDEFQGYDFKAGALASIIKILAYNTWLNNFYVNMAISESFLDTAQLQQSVFSHAKELNYIPSSATSAQAQVQMTWNGNGSVYVLSKGQQFGALVRGIGSLLFSIPENVTVTSGNGFFSANLTVYEGSYIADAYVMNYSDPVQRFFISNPNVDTGSVTVAVSNSGALEATLYTQASTLLGLNETSQVWFLQASEQGGYEVLFGDGVIGYRPQDGSTVVIDYRITKGSDGNGAKIFSPTFNPGNATNLAVTTITPSVGGANVQSTDSVRFYAPRYFQIQQRAVTADDYAIMLQNQFPEVIDAYAYGGETVTPPQYNTVYVSVNLSGIEGLPEAKVEEYTNFLQARCPLTTVPVIVTPIDQFLSVHSNVSYDVTQTSLSPADISSEVVAAITSYANVNLGIFNSTLRYSRFVAAIDDADVSIISNQTNYYAYQLISPLKGGTPQNFTLRYNYPLAQAPTNANLPPVIVEEYNIWTGPFIFNGQTNFLADDGLGNMRLIIYQGGNQIYSSVFGSVNYTTGVVQLTNFAPIDYNGSTLRVYARPQDSDILSPQNTILNIGDEMFITVFPS